MCSCARPHRINPNPNPNPRLFLVFPVRPYTLLLNAFRHAPSNRIFIGATMLSAKAGIYFTKLFQTHDFHYFSHVSFWDFTVSCLMKNQTVTH